LTDKAVSHVRLVYDAGPEDPFAYMQRDLPLSYDFRHRKHGFRRVSETTMMNEAAARERLLEPTTDHDPFMRLEDD
jgi:hypothetical protein